jgi:hypothetical protein
MPTISSHPHHPPDDLVLLDVPGGKMLRLRFHGPFEERLVRWDATLFTPDAWETVRGEGRTLHNIIEIGAEGAYGIELNICLQVECIDLPTIRKAVVMIRQYKRLQRGRHHYG